MVTPTNIPYIVKYGYHAGSEQAFTVRLSY